MIQPEAVYDVPPARYGHTMNVYNNCLVIFGGAGAYNEGMRVWYKFVHLFDKIEEKWLKSVDNTPQNQQKPDQRMYHSAAVFGSILMIYGGLNTEDKTLYDDMHIYDLHLNSWIDLKKKEIWSASLGHRYMHSMTSIVSSKFASKYSLSMWLKYPPKDPYGTMPSNFFGVYLFGGYKLGEGQMNDLWVIKPNHK